MASEGIAAGLAPDGTVGFLHLDMDAFYASVELLRRPELRGLPVVVGAAGRRGVVAAASYEARAFGIHSAMSSVVARRLCPEAVFLPGDIRLYGEVSERIMAILRDVTPLVEPLSLDEAFCDVRGVARLLGPAPYLAAEIRSRVLESERLTCSVGVGSSKLVAKMATEHAKPKVTPSGPVFGSGVYVVEAGEESGFLHPLPVEALFGVGPATAWRLAEIGVRTVGDLAALPAPVAVGALGSAAGRQLRLLARGIDDRPVVTYRPARSIGKEETFARDLRQRAEIDVVAARLADSVARRMRVSGVRARTVTVKVRFSDFTMITRSTTPPDPVRGYHSLVAVASGLLDLIDMTLGVRLLGVSGSGLISETACSVSAHQLCLDFSDGRGTDSPAESDRYMKPGDALFGSISCTDAEAEVSGEDRWRKAERVMGRIRDRFGSASIVPAVLVDQGRLGDSAMDAPSPWGPGGGSGSDEAQRGPGGLE